MKKLNIALLEDMSYSKCFSEYLGHKRNTIDILIFTSLESLKKHIENNVIDILLVGQKMVDMVAGNKQIERIIVLSEGNFVGEYSEYPVIFKYQSVEVIIKEILNIIADDDSISECQQKYSYNDKEFIGVFSPFGGSGVPMFSWQLTKQISRIKKTLYISLEKFDGLKINRNDTGYTRGMSEVVFYIRQKKGKLGIKIESLIKSYEGCDCILPVGDYRDLYSLTDKEMLEFVKVLSEETDYETIIFDIGDISEASIALMKWCDKLILPKAENGIQKNIQEDFKEFLEREGMEKVMSNIHCVSMCG